MHTFIILRYKGNFANAVCVLSSSFELTENPESATRFDTEAEAKIWIENNVNYPYQDLYKIHKYELN